MTVLSPVRWLSPVLAAVVVGVVAASAPAAGELGASPVTGVPPPPDALVENRGQWQVPAAFMARAGDVVARLEPGGLALQVGTRHPDGRQQGWLVRLVLPGEGISPTGVDRRPGVYNYLIGPDASSWRTGVRGFDRARYAGLLPGVDAVVSVAQGRLATGFSLGVGADAGRLTLGCRGVDGLSLDEDGSLVMATGVGPLALAAPQAWQVLPSGERRAVPCAYRILGTAAFGFEIVGADPALPSMIQTSVEWSSYLGGTKWESAYAAAHAADGSVVVAGQTGSSTFPTTAGAFDTTYNGVAFSDVFVTRADATGTTLVYSTFLGGSAGEEARAVVVDAAGAVTVCGTTSSNGFPTTPGALDGSLAGSSDAFVARLAPDGTALTYSTLLGGSSGDVAQGLAVDGSGSTTVVVTTGSSNFPTTAGVFDTTLAGNSDAAVARLSADGTSLLWSTFLGGSGAEAGLGLVVDADGSAIAVGTSDSEDFPVTAGAYDVVLDGMSDGWVARLSPGGDELEFATFLGGSDGDTLEDVALAPWGSLLVAGTTSSSDYPTTVGAFDDTPDGSSDAVVSVLSPDGTSLEASSLVGGGGGDVAFNVAPAPTGGVIVGGVTSSSDFPTTPDAFDGTADGSSDGFLARLSSDGTALLYGTLVGGSAGDVGEAMAADRVGGASLAGTTSSGDLVVSAGAFDPVESGSSESFVAHVNVSGPWTHLGNGLIGASGEPLLTGQGSLTEGTPVSIDLALARPGALAHLTYGLLPLFEPFMGGILVPDIFTAPGHFVSLFTDGAGAISTVATWPAGVPSGLELYLQYWIEDPGAMAGLSASNGLKATAP